MSSATASLGFGNTGPSFGRSSAFNSCPGSRWRPGWLRLANALLPSEHQGSVLRSVSHWLQRMTDLADRKMVAAALAALDAGNATQITNAADTDWIDCQQALHAVGLEVENLLPDWLQARWRQKHPPVRRAK